MRVFPLRTFYDTQTEVIVQHYISGKAILQWLCDCVCIYSENQGIGIAGLFLQLRLIEPIMLPPSIANYEKFNPSRNSFYKLTKLGLSVCHWNSSSVEVVNFSDDDDDDHDDGESLTFDSDTLIPTRDSSSRSNITLSMVLKDPGLRYLFKTHLEMEFCSENLQVFILLKDFKYSMKTLDKLFQTLPKVKDNAKLKIKLLQSIQKQLNTLKSMSYHIHFQYLTADAPNVLNLDLKLRDKVIHNMNERDEINEDVTQGEEDLLLREYDGITRKYEIFNEISNSVFRLMEIDSLPKFLNGKVYTKAMMTLDLIVE